MLCIRSVQMEISSPFYVPELTVTENTGAESPSGRPLLPQPPPSQAPGRPLAPGYGSNLQVKKSKVSVVPNLHYCFCHVLYTSRRNVL